ncbi:hypothetical protein [Corynebacterium sp.]|uniref:hypothetical protein n=1 Tax=Corynebacterium sp. TaxID=1720 RepID=UPI0026DC7001|nr:hypothetical protein [Corynebacterium sp.]MDO5031207.1 hypothetical protein [Corynebacterium sp.]
MNKLLTTTAALAFAAASLAACNNAQDTKKMEPSSEMIAPESDAMMSSEMMAPSSEMSH